MACSCKIGLRCPEAERLWRERAMALQQYQQDMTDNNRRTYQSADAAYQQHIKRPHTSIDEWGRAHTLEECL